MEVIKCCLIWHDSQETCECEGVSKTEKHSSDGCPDCCVWPENGSEDQGGKCTEWHTEPFCLPWLWREAFCKGHILDDHHRQPEEDEQKIDGLTESEKEPVCSL